MRLRFCAEEAALNRVFKLVPALTRAGPQAGYARRVAPAWRGWKARGRYRAPLQSQRGECWRPSRNLGRVAV